MKRFALVCASAVMLTNLVLGDFKSGLEAYERGDYAAAFWEWRPLAAQGDASAAPRTQRAILRNGEAGGVKTCLRCAAECRSSAMRG